MAVAGISLTNCFDRFMESAVFESGLSERTLSAYAADIRLYLRFLEEAGVKAAAEIRLEQPLDIGGSHAGSRVGYDELGPFVVADVLFDRPIGRPFVIFPRDSGFVIR